ncbi:MAG: cytochrome c [Actinobacteria bacterium]|nr:cytochrome c [Actinomycetota bacterium]MCZ6567834.1 cytochrome c [Actinomycetota bacterium]
MSEIIAAAAAALGIPEDLVRRSAEARAAETGASVDDVLAAWAGGDVVAATAPASEPAEVTAPEEEVSQPEPVATAPAAVALETPTATPQPPTRAPAPTEVTPGEAAHLPEVITVPTAGIRERTSFVIPKWLTAVFLFVPLFALFALGGASTGECGEATELMTDVVTGDIVNCDGSEFTGKSVDGGGTDYVALGGSIYAGAAITGVNCSGCHGANGQGSAIFPALTGVLTTFGACADHVEWVGLGSSGSLSAGESTYGDTSRPIAGGMPSFSSNLTEEQIAAVSAFERVRFGGGDPDKILIACGLAESPDDGEQGTGDGGDDSTEGDGETEASVRHLG